MYEVTPGAGDRSIGTAILPCIVVRAKPEDLENPVVRAFAAYALVGLLMLCPFVCGEAEVGHGSTHRHETSDSSPEQSHGPAHCPEGGDNCICEGAVQSCDGRVADAHDADLPFALAAILSTPPHPIAHLTWDGSSTGLAGWGDHPTVRAFLQNYRC